MIKESTLWQGGYLSLYEDEVHTWLRERTAEGEDFIRFDLGSLDPARATELLYETYINDDAIWFTPERALLIDRVNDWKAEHLSRLTGALQSLETQFTIAFVAHNFTKPIKALEAAITDTKYRDRGVPSDENGLAEWLMEWLDKRDVGLSRKNAVRIAEHVGTDTEIAVNVARALATGFEGVDLGWDDIAPQLGSLGAVNIFDLTKHIVAGDRERAIEVALRISASSHPLGVIKLLSNRYRQYAVASGDPKATPDSLVSAFGGSPYAAKYAYNEGRKLGPERTAKSIQLIYGAEHGCKGGSKLDMSTQIEVLVIQLAQQFSLAARER